MISEWGKLLELSDLLATLREMPGGPDTYLLSLDFKRHYKELVEGPALAPLSTDQKKIVLEVMTGFVQKKNREIADARSGAAEVQTKLLKLEAECAELRTENARLKTELETLSGEALRVLPEIRIDAQVVEYAGLFRKALTGSEEITSRRALAQKRSGASYEMRRTSFSVPIPRDMRRFASSQKLQSRSRRSS